MDSPADREPPRDVNPYQSPQWSAHDPAPADLLRAHRQGTIRVQGAITLRHARKAGLDNIGGPVGMILWSSLFGIPLLIVGWVGALAVIASEHGSTRFLAVVPFLMTCVLFSPVLWELLSTLRLRRLHREQRGIFAFHERTVTKDHIEATTGEGVARTSWNDYESCMLRRDLVVLRLRRQALRLRRQERSAEPLSWLDRRSAFDRLDVFPREHFGDELAWEAFVALAKRKFSRR